MMVKTLSSFATFFQKFIFSAIFISVAVGGPCLFIAGLIAQRQVALLLPVGLTLLWGAIAVSYCYEVTMPLKRVRVDDKHLYVSNYLREITVPFSEIAQVEEKKVRKTKLILIHLKSETEFGFTIQFVPQIELKWWWKEHSVVGELRSLAQATSKE
jgi:hypothetical protein